MRGVGSYSLRRLSASRRWLREISCVIILSTIAVGGVHSETLQDAMILGVHPYLSYAELRHRFEPLARYLSARLGKPVAVRIGESYGDHVREIGRDRVDIAFVGPVGYVRIADRYGSKPLLARLETDGRAELGGHFIVRKDSPLIRIRDLVGMRIGLGDPNSTMSSVVPGAVLRKLGISDDRLGGIVRFRNHTSIAIAVLSGQIDAGAVKSEVLERYRNRGLRSLHQLPTVTEHAFVARADLPEPIQERLQGLLLGLDASPAGRQVLRAIHRRATAMRPVDEQDYETLRSLLLTGDPDDA